MQLSPTRLFTCTACGSTLPVGEELIGKKCRCGRCGKVNLVGEETPHRGQVAPAQTNSESEQQPFSFLCRVCETRLVAQPKHVGRKAKCPDCSALTKVPQPPKARPQQKPNAMHGQQYGVWGVDEAPLPSEMATAQPKFYPVGCRVCDTLMHARKSQIGNKLSCPDCGAKTVVSEPPAEISKLSPLVPDGQEYQLDTTVAPPQRPAPQFSPPMSKSAQPAGQSPAGQSPGKQSPGKQSPDELPPIRQARTDRPKLPPLPIVVGVSRMLLCAPITTWLFWFVGIGVTAGGFMMLVVSLNPIAAIPFFIGAGFCLLLGLGALSALCMAVLTESSEGNDRLHNPPGPVFLDWVGDVFYVVGSATLAAAPWWILCQSLQQNVPFAGLRLIMLVGWLFTFPLLLLSCLENGSCWEPFSVRVLGSVARRPGHWLSLVIVSLAIIGGTGQANVTLLMAAAKSSSYLALLQIPLLVVGCLLYFRVLGRFAWWLAESLAVDEGIT